MKSHFSMTDALFKEIMDAFSEHPVSLYCATRKLMSLISIKPQWIDCCIDSCCAFTGIYQMLDTCPECDKPRYIQKNGKRRCRKKMAFFPLTDRLLIQYKDSARSQE